MAFVHNTKVEKFSIQSDTYSVSNTKDSIIPTSIQFYENILTPYLKCKVVIFDKEGIITKLPVVGGERVKFKVNISPYGTLDFSTDKNCFYVKSISIIQESRAQVAILDMVSREALSDHTARVVKRYDSISKAVDGIIKEVLASPKEIDIEEDIFNNEYTFLGNSKKPLEVLQWLATKAVPTTKSSSKGSKEGKTAGFAFFENQQGYNFKSIDGLLSRTVKPSSADLKKIPVYYERGSTQPEDSGYLTNILSYVVEKNNDVVESLRAGMYSNISHFFDIYDLKYEPITLKLSELYGKEMKTTSESKKSPTLPFDLQNYPSRLFVRLNDRGILKKDGKLGDASNLAKYQAQAAIRNNLIYSQKVLVKIPCNPQLKVGDLINCNFAKSTTNRKEASFDETLSGIYLISALQHDFSEYANNVSYTHLELIRDSYGVASSNEKIS